MVVRRESRREEEKEEEEETEAEEKKEGRRCDELEGYAAEETLDAEAAADADFGAEGGDDDDDDDEEPASDCELSSFCLCCFAFRA